MGDGSYAITDMYGDAVYYPPTAAAETGIPTLMPGQYDWTMKDVAQWKVNPSVAGGEAAAFADQAGPCEPYSVCPSHPFCRFVYYFLTFFLSLSFYREVSRQAGMKLRAGQMLCMAPLRRSSHRTSS